VGTDEQTQQPITANRSAKTVVVVDDQQTVVIGGLMRDRSRDSESKVPFLGDLPLIGWLFKQRSKEVEKVSLLLVLTPYIISEAEDFQRIFERKMKEHEEFAADYYGGMKEYRAHIDYSRKTGPFGKLSAKVRYEMGKLENGGEGDGSEVLVKPPVAPEGEVIDLGGTGGLRSSPQGDYEHGPGDAGDAGHPAEGGVEMEPPPPPPEDPSSPRAQNTGDGGSADAYAEVNQP
jgi:general secretion pathway protein D